MKLSGVWDENAWPANLFDRSPVDRWNKSVEWLEKARKQAGPVSTTLGPEAEATWPPWKDLRLTPDRLRRHEAPGNGAINAWLVIIGAAEGTSDSPDQEQEGCWEQALYFAQPHRGFLEYDDTAGLFKTMYRQGGAVPAYFDELGLEHEAGLGLTFSCNLIPGKQTNSTQPGIELLRKEEHVSRVLSEVEWTHCRCIIALLSDVYTVLAEAFAKKFGEPSKIDLLQSDSWKQKPPWSIWQPRKGSSILLARAPTHPSWRHTGWVGISQYGAKLAKLAKAELGLEDL